MKLRQITENMIMQQIRGQLPTSGAYVARPFLHTGLLYNPTTGHDAAANNAGMTMLPTGVPHKQRHRQFLGLQRRPGTITL